MSQDSGIVGFSEAVELRGVYHVGKDAIPGSIPQRNCAGTNGLVGVLCEVSFPPRGVGTAPPYCFQVLPNVRS